VGCLSVGSGWSRLNGKGDAQLREAGETLNNIASNIPPCALKGALDKQVARFGAAWQRTAGGLRSVRYT